MAYNDRYGITQIVDGDIGNLSVSYDEGGFRIEDDETGVFLLYTPHMDDKIEHYHIELNVSEAEKLHEWLGQFLNEYKGK